MQKGPNWFLTAWVGIIFMILGIWFYLPVFQELLLPIHAWAQADRLSIAFQFYENGFHFFKPQTYNLQPLEGVVGVELPLQSYLAALLGTLFGKQQIPILYKLITLSLWFAAMLSIAKLVFAYTHNRWTALIPVLFVFASPLLIYYSFNYLPDIAGFSLLILGFCQLMYAIEDQEFLFKKALLGLWICILAALVKLLLSFYLPFWVIIILHQIYRRRSDNWKKQLIILLAHAAAGLGVILAYYFYIQHLQQAYDSYIFLSKANPLSGSWQEIKAYLLEKVLAEWKWDYLSLSGYLLLLISLATAVSAGIVFWKKSGKYVFLALGLLSAGIAGLYLMGNQLIAHDYYVINLFFPICLFTVAAAAIQWGKLADKLARWANGLLVVLCLFLLVRGIIQAEQQFRWRCNYKNIVQPKDISWLKGLKVDQQNLPIPPGETILLLGGEAPNQGLVYFQRNGLIATQKQLAGKAEKLRWIMEGNRIHFLILSRAQQEEIANQEACFFERFEKMAEHENYFIYRLNGLKGWTSSLHADTVSWFTDFEHTMPCDSPSLEAKSGKQAIWVNEKHNFSYSWYNTSPVLGLSASLPNWKISASAWMLVTGDSLPATRKIRVMAFIGNHYQEQCILASFLEIPADSGWQKISFSCPKLEIEPNRKDFVLFFSSPKGEKGTVYIDDLKLDFSPEPVQP